MYYQNPYLYQPQSNDNSLIPIPSESEARNYPVAYGHSVTFRDENKPYLYTKTAISQMEPMIFKRFRITEEQIQETPQIAPQNAQMVELSSYVTKAEFEALQKELKALQEALGGVGNV